MVCRQCGTEIADKALICYRCGTATTEPLYKPVKPGSGRSRRGLVLAIIIAAALLALLYLLFPGSLGLTGVAPDATAPGHVGRDGRLPVTSNLGDRFRLIDAQF